MTSASEFHLSRIAFAELPSGEVVITTDDHRGHNQWLKEDYNIDEVTFETLVRGYSKGNKVVFYMGSDFKPVNDNKRVLKIADALGNVASGKGIFDGVIIGKVGEEWKIISTVRECT